MIIYNDDGTVEINGIVYNPETDEMPNHDANGIPVEFDE